jgi:hypothetical protein
MMHDPTAQDMPPLPLFDEEALDIANCLGAEPDADDIHTDKTRRQGVAALTPGGRWVSSRATSVDSFVRRMRSSILSVIPGAAFLFDQRSRDRALGALHTFKHNECQSGNGACAGAAGLRFDVKASTFFLGCRRAVATGPGWELQMDRVYVALSRIAAEPTDFYHQPRDRVVKLGVRVAN